MKLLKQNITFKRIIIAIVVAFTITYFIQIFITANILTQINEQVEQITQEQQNFTKNYAEDLFDDHLSIQDKLAMQGQIRTLEAEIEEISNKSENDSYIKTQNIHTQYQSFQKNLDRNIALGISSDLNFDPKDWGDLLLKEDYDKLLSEVSEANVSLEADYKDYIASLPPPPSQTGEGYAYTSVATSKGTFNVSLIKVPFNSVKVKTISANDDTCTSNCKTKTLAEYVNENNGYAGMNGSYFCPPDYASCSGKINSFDFAFYNSKSGEWMNDNALSWFETGMITFNGNSAKFYEKTSEYGGSSVTAAISNYPSLLKDGDIVVDSGDLTSYQKDVKGTRGAIGLGGENLYLALIYNATVIDAAHVMQALGAKHALNLDGGGSSAMYVNGSYVVGPGRALPNAIVLTK